MREQFSPGSVGQWILFLLLMVNTKRSGWRLSMHVTQSCNKLAKDPTAHFPQANIYAIQSSVTLWSGSRWNISLCKMSKMQMLLAATTPLTLALLSKVTLGSHSPHLLHQIPLLTENQESLHLKPSSFQYSKDKADIGSSTIKRQSPSWGKGSSVQDLHGICQTSVILYH